jgi:CMP-N,N'-diacetyllegionaminic acid synthase
MWEGRRVLAVVPARGGSKGIPRKNLCLVAGRSLIAWTAATVQALPWIDSALLSTDDEEIAAEGRRHGLAAPFLRPAELASDTATGVAAWRHAWLAAEAHWGHPFELSVYLQPTTPLRRPEEVTRTLATLMSGPWRSATTVAAVPGHFVPEKLLHIDATGGLRFHHPAGAATSNRQGAESCYYRTGACYAAHRETVVDRQQILEEACAAVLAEGPVVNIDEPLDLFLADCLARNPPPLA